ncbi:MAG TPA: hypothetical protein PLD25_28245 [Chloroflexota bacterium]|nr:hypothetical protein [Chloroflexota bacterium]HUM68042.1 hypothetical protein [Chloroflexota bacterium]
MLNKFFAFILFLVGIVLIILAVFLYDEAWPIIWRLGLGLLMILGAVLLANLDTVSDKPEKWD